MAAVKHRFSFCKIDFLRFFLSPRKSCDEIKVIVEHSVLRAVASVLFQAVDNLVSLAPRILIHTGLFNSHFHALNVGHIFRMHFIKLFLQIIELLFYCLLFIQLFVIFLLRSRGIVLYLSCLAEFIQHLLKLISALRSAVNLEKVITFFI